MIHGFLAYAVEALVIAPTLGLTFGLLFAQNRRRRYEEERVELEAKLKELRSARSAHRRSSEDGLLPLTSGVLRYGRMRATCG